MFGAAGVIIRCSIQQIPLASGAALGHYGAAGGPAERLEDMKQISTGAGLAILGCGIFGATLFALAGQRSRAMAQGSGIRQVVGFAVTNEVAAQFNGQRYHRLWSDGSIDRSPVIETRWTSYSPSPNAAPMLTSLVSDWVRTDASQSYEPILSPFWQEIPMTVPAPLATDVDRDGDVNGADISQVLMDFGARSDQAPPIQIDCTINQVK